MIDVTFRSITHIRERHYLYEKESYRDAKSRSRKQRVVRYLGPCDKKGNLLAEPRPRVDHVQSAFPMGRLALFTAIAQELRIVERAEELGLDGLVVRHLLCLALNQMIERLARRRLASWVRASPLPVWLSIPSETLTPTTYDGVLSAVCHHDRISRHMDNRGPVLQDAWNRAWRGSSREPAAAYYDITKQRYYGTHCSLAQMGHDSERGLSTVVGFGLVVSR
ncbi:transposase, partial [mine drainage metagenome]